MVIGIIKPLNIVTVHFSLKLGSKQQLYFLINKWIFKQ
jgi:hypothetical protein